MYREIEKQIDIDKGDKIMIMGDFKINNWLFTS